LEERNLSYLLNSFVLNKINDRIAFAVEGTKLMEIGLVYGDVIAFRQKFPPISQGDQTLSS